MERVAFKILLACALIACCTSLTSCGDSGKAEIKRSDIKNAVAKDKPTIEVVQVQEHLLNESLTLPGELRAYQDVPIHAKVEGYISWIGVDRGSIVKTGDKLITIFCPELDEKLKEAAAKVSSAESSYKSSKAALDTELSKQVEYQAKLDADNLTYTRLAEAAETPGAIAQNEVDISFQTVAGDKARIASQQASIHAATSVVAAQKENVVAAKNVYKAMQAMQAYLTIKAPFDGVITERNVHTGSIVAVDAARKGSPLVRIQEKSLLRLVVPVPESATGGVENGKTIPFTVPAYLGKTFTGTVARLGYALDSETRTMPVELNAWNPTGELEPGMFATVQWPVTRKYKTLFVPSAAVGSDLKGTYIDKIENGGLQRLTAKRGQPMGDAVEVLADGLKAGDEVALRATNEIENGTPIVAKLADEKDIQAAKKTTQAGAE